MTSIKSRLTVLEVKSPEKGRVDLDRCTDDELERLEAIMIKVEGGLPITALPIDEIRLIASLRILGE
ncbi:hypothetical protein A8B75_11585 [Sphingomonadales bacterium EhC05]|nr:hypothetical protein A8B75_11585 [Sphingomonadales bacterium EhC05]